MKLRLIIVFSLIVITVLSQSKIYTNIQNTKKKYPNKDFYFEHVLDRRINKENIGFGYKSSLTYKHPIDFKKTLPQEFLGFLRSTFPNQRSSNRILVAVNQFELEHSVTGKNLDTGLVKANFDFYLFRNDSAFFLYNFKVNFLEASDRVTTSQPNRMKRVILKSIAKLDSALLMQSLEFSFNLNEFSDSIRTNASNLTVNSFLANDSLIKINNYPSERFLLIGESTEISSMNVLAYLNIDLLFQLKKHPRILVGPSLKYYVYGIFFEASLPLNTEYRLKNIEIGLRVVRQINKNLFFNFQPLFLYGTETLDHQNFYFQNGAYVKEPTTITSEIVYGGILDAGLYLIPAQKQNFYVGADLFFRATSSSVLEGNVGVKINLGFKF